MTLTAKLKKTLLSIDLFSRAIIKLPLHRYQSEPAQAIIDSVINNEGLEFLLVFPRQSGKDETIGQIQVYLLTIYHRTDGSMVHAYPTTQQIATGTTRLENRLNNPLTGDQWWSKANPTRRGVGRAQVTFFSGHPQAKAEGATANLLLIINEVQDQDEQIVERRFIPMRASTNATAVYVGTVRTTSDYLWRVKTRLERLEAADGRRRVFMVTPEQVGQDNASYAAFVANQIATKGRHHPSVKTELFNEPLDTASGLFPPRRVALMRGSHPQQRAPKPGQIIVITVDVGGQDEAATAAFAELTNPGRDYTVATVFEVNPAAGGAEYRAVGIFLDHGSRHFQDVPGQPSLFARLCTFIERWKPVAVITDTTGVGQGITDALLRQFPATVFPFDFARNNGKARLGNGFLSLIETGRFKYFCDGQREGGDSWWFFTQAEHCGYELAEGAPIERGLRWSVEPSAKVTCNGEQVPVHDDRLLSAALIAEADRLNREGKLFFSTGVSTVIRRDF